MKITRTHVLYGVLVLCCALYTVATTPISSPESYFATAVFGFVGFFTYFLYKNL